MDAEIVAINGLMIRCRIVKTYVLMARASSPMVNGDVSMMAKIRAAIVSHESNNLQGSCALLSSGLDLLKRGIHRCSTLRFLEHGKENPFVNVRNK
ncbi:hypothetical protein AVEN_252889-1 [Araneus ventricosus]|uniref:Uncharacterized protein n=1 Tax=Araneus ventricosus TaxID=182803 RepID=A0A4Y2KYN2_ARAVE|nr:hypothetical protein AVEN_252889-1 [Araneus ventricosus]